MHDDQIWDISFSADGNFLAVGNGTEFVAIWNFFTKEKLMDRRGSSFNTLMNCCFHSVFSPNSEFLAVRIDKGCLIYKTESQEMLCALPQKE